MSASSQEISSWTQFNALIRDTGADLLHRLDEFPDSILVTGCQRSGTTMLSRIITKSDGMVNYWFGPDDELDAALILSGAVDHQPRGRYCFQTTYLNERYHEYFQHRDGHRILWVLRNPYSVVYSMLHNWGGHPPDRLFLGCGVPVMTGLDRWRYRLLGTQGLTPLRKACWGYLGKTLQVFELRRQLGEGQFRIIEYDALVQHKHELLPQVYHFIDLPFQDTYAAAIHASSLDKQKLLNPAQIHTIRTLCEGVYRRARQLVTYGHLTDEETR